MNIKNREIVDLQLSLVLFAVVIYRADLSDYEDETFTKNDMVFNDINLRFNKLFSIKLTMDQYMGLFPIENISELYYKISSIIGFGNLKPQALSMLDDYGINRVLNNYPYGIKEYADILDIHPFYLRDCLNANMFEDKDLNRLVNLHFILN